MTDYDERGNPLPKPSDECEVCGRSRTDAEELYIEVLEPYGEVEYLCGDCESAGRGLK
ncbi:MAG: hypothetical protein ACOCZD_00075 [Haloferacaceae archaeon]